MEVVEDTTLRMELVQKVKSLKNPADEEVTVQIELAIQNAFFYGWLEDMKKEPAGDSSVEEKVEAALAAEELELLLHRVLNERELLAMRMRYGLNGKDETALKDIATELGVSSPRASQIVSAALQKVKNAPELVKITEAGQGGRVPSPDLATRRVCSRGGLGSRPRKDFGI